MKSFIWVCSGRLPSRRFNPAASAVLFTLVFALPLFGQWEPDSQLTFDPSLSNTSYNNAWCVAAAGDTVHVVWWDDRLNSNGDIFYKRSQDAGTTWGADTRIRIDTADTYSYAPAVAVSGSIVHAVWVDGRDGTYEIYYKRSTNSGTTWGSDTPLTLDPAFSYYPSVAASGPNVHVVWRDNRDNANHYEIYYKRSIDGGMSWGPDTRLTVDTAESWYPSIAVSGDNVHVVWWDDRDVTGEIYYKCSTDNGMVWGPDTRMTNETGTSDFASIAASSFDIHIAWRESRDGNLEIYYKRSTDYGNSWGPDTRLTNSPGFSSFPSVAVSGSNVHVVWTDNRDGNREIYYKRSTDRGTTWETDTRLTNAAFFSLYPSVAVSGTKVHVVWEDNRIPNYEIFYKRNPTGNPGTGVEENDLTDGRMPVMELNTVPNPFISFATIPGHEHERFALYDVSGRQVGAFRGDRIGENLTPGVYFLRSEENNAESVRIVKLK